MIPAIYTIPIQHLASGDRNFLQVYQFRGAKPGKKAYLQANLHGAEIVGNAVIYQLIEFLRSLDDTQLAGEVWLVPVCNPMGTNQRSHFFATGRYNPYDGRDWNRIFWDYQKEGEDLATFAQSQINLQPEKIRHNYLARIQSSFQQQLGKINSLRAVPFREYYRYQLQSLCLDANYVIDIHSSSNQAIDYLYCFHSREESAKAFQLPYGILLKEYAGNTFDEAFLKPWLALEKKLAELGKYIRFDLESWTLELGAGMVMNPESITKGVIGIENYLAYHGMLTIPGFPLAETGSFSIDFISKSQIQEYYAPMGGMIQSRVELGSEVQAGQVLYQLLVFHKNGELPTLIEISAETDGVIFNLSTSQSVNQGEYVLSIISN